MIMFNQLHYFISLVKNNSFTKVAEECHISQPAISQQIKELEATLNVSLIERKGRGFVVTPAGMYFCQQARLLLKKMDQAIQETQKIAGQETQIYHLRVGYLKSIGSKELLKAVADFSTKFPQVKIEITSGGHEKIFKMLANNQLDIVLNDLRRATSDKYVNNSVIDLDLKAVLKPVLIRDNAINNQNLTNLNCILVADHDEQQTEQDYYRQVLGVRSNFVIVNNYEDALLLVASGQGYLLLNERITDQLDKDMFKVVDYLNNETKMQQKIYLFWQRDNSGYYIESFAQELQKQFTK